MAHQSLYRKYRPQTFSDVVGQQHIERTLRNAVGDGTVAHAYLFTGPRGTGKTTTARILAKALNCEHGPTSDPDGTCEQCIEIAEGRHPDVYELDAASRTGVDNVREEIIGRVQYAPTKGRYKVYIIDEVHMLSTAAFNALLKTLEEPPSHVVFIMATTHPQKVPETIQSRCQRFDFHRIGIDEIAGRLRVIADGEGFEVPDAALTLMARHAAGGMRDAITTLEQLAAFTGGTIRLDDVEGLLGEVDSAQLFEVAGLVARRDIAACFRWVARFAEEGTDLAEFVRELTGHVRNLYVIAAVGDGHGIVDASAEELGKLESQAAAFGGPDRLSRVLDLLGELASEMRWSSDPRLSLEVALTRMARPQGEMTLEALAERVEAVERGGTSDVASAGGALRSGSSPGALAPSTPAPAAEPSPRVVPAGATSASDSHPTAAPVAVPDAAGAAEPEAEALNAEPAVAEPHESALIEEGQSPAEPVVVVDIPTSGELDRAAVRRSWPAVLVEIKKLKAARAHMFAQVEADVDVDGKTLVLEFPADQEFAMQIAEEPEARDMLRKALTSALGFAPPTRFQLGYGAVRPPETTVARTGNDASESVSDDSEPLPEYYETGAGFTEPGVGTRVTPKSAPVSATRAGPVGPSDPPAAAPSSDLERLLLQDLGAKIVAEHDSAPSGGGAENGEPEAIAGIATPAIEELDLLDPEMFDEDDDGEEDQ